LTIDWNPVSVFLTALAFGDGLILSRSGKIMVCLFNVSVSRMGVSIEDRYACSTDVAQDIVAILRKLKAGIGCAGL
jgi:hypothetical protein